MTTPPAEGRRFVTGLSPPCSQGDNWSRLPSRWVPDGEAQIRLIFRMLSTGGVSCPKRAAAAAEVSSRLWIWGSRVQVPSVTLIPAPQAYGLAGFFTSASGPVVTMSRATWPDGTADRHRTEG